jgi:basic amino acid/polyamine antiporter, APA family
MATATRAGLLARKPTATLIAEAGDQRGLQRAVGALDLTALGIGGIIGTGIFVIIGEAIGDSGPAIVLSFVLAAVTCVFSAATTSRRSRPTASAGSPTRRP